MSGALRPTESRPRGGAWSQVCLTIREASTRQVLCVVCCVLCVVLLMPHQHQLRRVRVLLECMLLLAAFFMHHLPLLPVYDMHCRNTPAGNAWCGPGKYKGQSALSQCFSRAGGAALGGLEPHVLCLGREVAPAAADLACSIFTGRRARPASSF
eukprot:COSAG06_NODE_2269_length_7201_cov_19.631090_2_plen_154_part_00